MVDSPQDGWTTQNTLQQVGSLQPTVDWRSLLQRHPMFSDLDEQEVVWLLSNEVSRELQVEAGGVIVQAGEWSTSAYLIGSGAVQVVLPREAGGEIVLTPLGPGQCFGEMAAIEQQPRSATVVAQQKSTLLEIKGEDFVRLLKRHPGTEFKLLLTVSERLRRLGEAVIENRLDSVNQRIELFASRLEAEKKGFDATRNAAEAFFRETERRSNDVIANAERNNQNWERTLHLIAWVGTVIGAIASTVVIFLTWFGVSELKDIQAYRDALEARVVKIEERIQEKLESVERVEVRILADQEKLSELDEKVAGFYDARRRLYKTLLPKALESEIFEAKPLYRLLLTSGDDDIALDLLTSLWQNLAYQPDQTRRVDLLEYLGKDADQLSELTYKVRVMIEFLKATGSAIERETEDYDRAVARLRGEVVDHDYESVRSSLQVFSFNPEAFLGAGDQPEALIPPHLHGKVRDLILDAWRAVP